MLWRVIYFRSNIHIDSYVISPVSLLLCIHGLSQGPELISGEVRSVCQATGRVLRAGTRFWFRNCLLAGQSAMLRER